MKKIIFLLCLMCVVITHGEVSYADLYETYEFESFTIETERFGTEQGERGYYLTKRGNSPFETTILIDNAWVDIRGMKEIDELLVIYGDVHYLEADTFYDAYVLIMNKQGDIVHEYIDDYGNMEIVDDVFKIDDVWIFRTHQTKRTTERPEFLQYVFRSFDLTFTYLDEFTVERKILIESVEDELYVFSYDTLDYYQAAIDEQFNFYEYNTPLDIEENAQYHGSVYLPVINEATLNGNVISNGYKVSTPGYYELVYNQNTYTFTIEAQVSGIEDGGIYQDAVSIDVNHNEAYLNDDLYVSQDKISSPGNYTFEVRGANGYKKVWQFQITSKITGVVNNQTYQRPLQIEFDGHGYLNNQYVESPLLVDDPGEYVLQIKGENSYLETIHFQIEAKEKETNWIHFIQQYDIFVFIAVGISSIIYLKKK
ncbi:MAG: hypothetical protein UMR38_07360 [Candidatus Izemoplasma sp.]|nr:hypothetical protein [Candidatus Izemoplasma sp.]